MSAEPNHLAKAILLVRDGTEFDRLAAITRAGCGKRTRADLGDNDEMARSLWNGVISFGMVSIPVSLSTATQEKDLRFHQVHKTCGSRIKQQKYCPVDERVVSSDELVRGYEISKGKTVILEDKDFEDLPVPSLHTIEVLAFVKAEEIDPIYYDTTYYVEPNEMGIKPYALLLKALEAKGMSALSKIALRNKENLCLLRNSDGKVILETLYYPDEIKKAPEIDIEKVKVGEKELNMAMSLVDILTEEFEPEKYKDEYREALLERIKTKVEGGEVQHATAAEKPTEVIDLMDALKKSVDAARKGREKSG